ncbi:glycosyltransferase [Micromonospora sp. NPDC005806]|uniref:glycosyltransferase n=1 Tax=Micromonospora sp. NPDC005806 TaxID=3364234 RepID=UPI003683113D
MAPGIAVGVAAGEAGAVADSLEFLAVHTDPAVPRIRLDGVGPRAFNELAATGAAVVVLLEAGVRVGPRWLDLLTAAMDRTGAGLAGPSTNRAWNEQSCVGVATPDLRGIRRDASALLRRFGHAVRTLAPLYSLGDFCYAVRREVIDAIGPADIAYGEGPCWEMDYNVRAARAGFDGIWVGGAYVWRPPPAAESEAQMRRARELYQDRFCGLRLRGTGGYQPHCRGEECAEFAPLELITIRPAGPPVRAMPRTPLVSCVMPTRDRNEFAVQAVRYFLGQNYPHRELVVVADGPVDLPPDPRVRVLTAGRTATPSSIGALRNLGCTAARGEFVVLWDDDDWHGPTRVSDQVAPLLEGHADITALAGLDWFEPATWRAWRLTPELHRKMLRRDVYAGTMAFRRGLLRHHRFPDWSLAEDADFLDRAVRAGARLRRINGQGRYVYVRHGGNSWQVDAGRAVRADGWTPAPVPNLPPGDRAFYAALARPLRTAALVSCIMPTRDRRPYVVKAVEYFLRQDHPAKELIVLDDGDDPVADVVPGAPGIHYHRLDRPLVLGAKRNRACEIATGEVIVHWDDDDWQAPHRLRTQLARLDGADLCGAASLMFWEPGRDRAWRYTWPGRRAWAAGTSLCYPRSLWQGSPFAEIATGEDTRFLWRAPVRRLADVAAENCVVGLVHPGNTVAKSGRNAYWNPIGVGEVTACLGPDASFYRNLSRVA